MNEDAIEQAKQALIEDFQERVEELRRDGLPDYPPLGGTISWADASEQRKLEAIIWESMEVRVREISEEELDVIGVPGFAALEEVERYVDYAGLPHAQRQLLTNLRDAFDAGDFDQSPEEHQKDFLGLGLARVVGIDHFDRMLDAAKSNAENPWGERSEIEKLAYILDATIETGPPGKYTLAAIEREVDYDRLPPWRWSPLETLRREIDAGHYDYENPDPATNDDPIDRALRCIELKARIEAHKLFGVLDERGERRAWDTFDETAKFDRIMEEINDLHLQADSSAYAQIVAEVDRSRIPPDKRRDFEERREQTWRWREMEHDAFDDVVADLPQHWYDAGLAAPRERWEDKPVFYKVAYLAEFAAAMDVPFNRFMDASLNLFGRADQSRLTPEEGWFMARTFFDERFRHTQRQLMSEAFPSPAMARAALQDNATAVAGGSKAYRSPSELLAEIVANREETSHTHEHEDGLDYER